MTDKTWDTLLTLITQYGTERFMAGWRASNRPLNKVDGTGTAEGSDLLTRIVMKIEQLRYQAGDD